MRFQSERVRCFKCVSNAFAINRGTDNTFSKDAGRTRNNIGRVDLILNNPIVITQQQASDFADANSGDNLLENIGFLLMERGGNDHYAVAAIREIKNIDALLDGTDTATADNLNVTQLQNFARLLRTYDNLPFESPGTGPFADRPQLIAEGRSATSLVTQLGPLLNTLEKTDNGAIPGGLGDIWGTTSENISTTVIMSSEAEVGNADHFYENRPDQNLSAQSPNGSFITLADLGFDFGDLAVDGDGELLKNGNVEFFGVSQFAADVRTDTAVDYDLITLTNIPRDTTAASGFGGLDFTGGGGFFSRDDTPLLAPQLSVAKALTGQSSDPIVEGTTLTYTITATNTGDVALTNMVVTDDLITPTGGTTPCASVAVGGTCTLIGTYVVTAADVDAGQVVNTGTAVSDETPPVDDELTTPVPQNPGIAIIKTGTLNDDDGTAGVSPGDSISYVFTVENIGNVTLTNITLSDPDATISGGPIPSLAVGASDSTTFTASYIITQSDIDAGSFTNTATASSDEGASDDDSDTQPLAQTPALVLTKTGTLNDDDGTAGVSPGDSISYVFTVENIGNVTLTNITLSDPDATISGGPIPSLAVGASDSTTFTASYIITQSDIDAGSFTNTATASSDEGASDDDSDTQPLAQTPALVLTKTGTLNDDDGTAGVSPGDSISYVFTVENIGNVTLTNITLSDPDATISGGPIPSLAVGASDSTTFTASYIITQSDIDAGSFTNTATASSDEGASDDDSDTQPLAQTPALVLTKTGTLNDDDGTAGVSPGDSISYVFTVENIGNVTLTNITLSDPDATISGGPIPSLAVGASDSTTFTASYIITQSDIDAGSFTNTATASSDEGASDDDSDTQPLAQTPALVLTKTGTLNDDDGTAGVSPGDSISYVFTVENIGNVTLTNITLSDPDATISGGPIPSLAVGASDSTTFTASYIITQSDIDAGSFTNTATASSDEGASDDDSDTQPLAQTPALVLTKTGTLNDDDGTAGVSPGDSISYVFTVENIGNVTLTNITLSDPDATISGGPIPSLAVGASDSTTFTASYIITQSDIDAGSFTNTATASSDEGDQRRRPLRRPQRHAAAGADTEPWLPSSRAARSRMRTATASPRSVSPSATPSLSPTPATSC